MNRKKLFFRTTKCFFAMLLFLSTTAITQAQQGIVVKAESGSTTSISFTNVYKLQFANETMTVVSPAAVTGQSFVLAATSSFSFAEVSVNGLFDPQSNPLSIKVYPTVTSDMIYVAGADQGSKANVYSITGAKVMDFKFQSNSESINVSSLNNGVYFLRIDEHTFKFNKQ